MKINAAQAIPPEQLGIALSTVLLEWAENQEKDFVKAIDAAAEACNETAKQYAPTSNRRRSGTYRNNFAIDKGWQERHHYTEEWHVKTCCSSD